MPAFFVISGYLHRVTKEFALKKHFKRLIIPTLFYNLIGYVIFIIKNVYSGNVSFDIHTFVIKPIAGIFIYNQNIATPMCSIMWFLITMFFVKAIMGLILDDKNSTAIITVTLCLILSYILINVDFIGRISISIPFYIFGYYLKKNHIVNFCSISFK